MSSATTPKAAAELVKNALAFANDLFAGRAEISITPNKGVAAGWSVRFVRDPPPR